MTRCDKKNVRKIKDGGYFRFEYITESIRNSEKIVKQKVTQSMLLYILCQNVQNGNHVRFWFKLNEFYFFRDFGGKTTFAIFCDVFVLLKLTFHGTGSGTSNCFHRVKMPFLDTFRTYRRRALAFWPVFFLQIFIQSPCFLW
jgi:hypothetical protein